MRLGASRRFTRILLFAAAFVLLGGCASETKRQYLRHLTLTLDPISVSNVRTGVTDRDGAGAEFAAMDRNRPSR